ncbi:hypothetical protein PCE1_002251 [Barthelona sp. PCE]
MIALVCSIVPDICPECVKLFFQSNPQTSADACLDLYFCDLLTKCPTCQSNRRVVAPQQVVEKPVQHQPVCAKRKMKRTAAVAEVNVPVTPILPKVQRVMSDDANHIIRKDPLSPPQHSPPQFSPPRVITSHKSPAEKVSPINISPIISTAAPEKYPRSITDLNERISNFLNNFDALSIRIASTEPAVLASLTSALSKVETTLETGNQFFSLVFKNANDFRGTLILYAPLPEFFEHVNGVKKDIHIIIIPEKEHCFKFLKNIDSSLKKASKKCKISIVTYGLFTYVMTNSIEAHRTGKQVTTSEEYRQLIISQQINIGFGYVDHPSRKSMLKSLLSTFCETAKEYICKVKVGFEVKNTGKVEVGSPKQHEIETTVVNHRYLEFLKPFDKNNEEKRNLARILTQFDYLSPQTAHGIIREFKSFQDLRAMALDGTKMMFKYRMNKFRIPDQLLNGI